MSGGRPLGLLVDVSDAHRGVYRVREGRQEHVLDATVERVRRAEEAGFVAAFLFDTVAFDPRQHHPEVGALEPLVLLTALSQATTSIGLVATVSTTYWDPYNLARILASLDHVSGGRAAWNAVTSYRGEWNYGYEQIPPPAVRYARATEFIHVVQALWSSWSPSSVAIRDGRAVGDIAQISPIHHRGEFFAVDGPLDVPLSPQRWPVLFQAGSSDLGLELGGRLAEVVYAAAPTAEHAEEIAAKLRGHAVAHNRPSGIPRLYVNAQLLLGRTEKEVADAEERRIAELDLDAGRAVLAEHLAVPHLDDLDLDEVLPESLFVDEGTITRRAGRYQVFKTLALDKGLTLRELIVYASGVGHWRAVGTPGSVADQIEHRYRRGTLDLVRLGFSGAEQEDLVYDALVPELRRRGLVEPTPPAGITLRERLGLPHPWEGKPR